MHTKTGSSRDESFYVRTGKRWLDVALAAPALILLSPIFVIVAALLKITSREPILFRQERAGKDGRSFSLVKFRTMTSERQKQPSPITVAGDPRITRVGTILRRYKIDELPQLWNVLKGDMSLVGPRPEVECYVKWYTPQQRKVLAMPPGITDPASIAYRHEEETLRRDPNPEQYYRSTILPHKLSLSLEYVEAPCLRRDLSILWDTIRSVFN